LSGGIAGLLSGRRMSRSAAGIFAADFFVATFFLAGFAFAFVCFLTGFFLAVVVFFAGFLVVFFFVAILFSPYKVLRVINK
jgi:hypothetical protein